jgi:outer membrane autotransporter protein
MPIPSQSFFTRVLGFGATALLAAAAASPAVAQESDNSGPNTWVGHAIAPIWDLGGGGFKIPVDTFSGSQIVSSRVIGNFSEFGNNWSYGTIPSSTDDVLFPNVIPTFSNPGELGSQFSGLGNGQTILVGMVNSIPDPNSITFLNNYTLEAGSTFAPGSVLFVAGRVVLPVTSGNITVGSGYTATFIDVDLTPGNGTITKLGGGSLILNDQVNGNIFIQQGLLGGTFTVTGNLINHGTLSPGDAPGTVTVHGNYQQGKGANLNLKFASATSYDQLLIGGTASLGGNANVIFLDGFTPKKGEKFKVIYAGSISGEFDDINAPVWDDMTLRPFYGKNSVTFRAVVDSFANLPGLTPNQEAVAQNLDKVLFDPRDAKLLNYLYGQSLNQLPADFDKIGAEGLTSIFAIGTSLATLQSQNIQNRNDNIRNGSTGFNASGLALNGSGPSYSGGFGFGAGVAGPNGDDGKDTKEMKAVAPVENRWGAFLSGTGEWVNVGSTDNARGYDLTSGGFTLGVDYKVCPNFAIGLMGGYTGTTADLTDHGRVWVNGGKIGIYATTFVGGWYADAAVDGGYNSYDTRRSGIQGEVRGDTDGGELGVLFGTGYDFKAGAFTFGPTASFNYTYTGMNGFTESGSLAPLDIHGGSGESLRSAFGFKASYDWKVGSVVIKPEIRAAWQHEYGDSAYALDSSFANGSGGNFTVNGPKLGRDSALLGAGFAIQCSERCSTYFYYDGEVGRTNYQSNAVTGGVRVSF